MNTEVNEALTSAQKLEIQTYVKKQVKEWLGFIGGANLIAIVGVFFYIQQQLADSALDEFQSKLEKSDGELEQLIIQADALKNATQEASSQYSQLKKSIDELSHSNLERAKDLVNLLNENEKVDVLLTKLKKYDDEKIWIKSISSDVDSKTRSNWDWETINDSKLEINLTSDAILLLHYKVTGAYLGPTGLIETRLKTNNVVIPHSTATVEESKVFTHYNISTIRLPKGKHTVEVEYRLGTYKVPKEKLIHKYDPGIATVSARFGSRNLTVTNLGRANQH